MVNRYESRFLQSIWNRVRSSISNPEENLSERLSFSITDLVAEALKENPDYKLVPEAAIEILGNRVKSAGERMFDVLGKYMDPDTTVFFSRVTEEKNCFKNYNQTVILAGDFIGDPAIEIVYDHYEEGKRPGYCIPPEQLIKDLGFSTADYTRSEFFQWGGTECERDYLLVHRKGTQKVYIYTISPDRSTYSTGWCFFDKIISLGIEIGNKLDKARIGDSR